MAITQQFNSIDFYYTFEYYLHEQELDYTVLDYAHNNGFELQSLICFFDIIRNNIHYIITTNDNNSHQVISIAKCSNMDNLIFNSVIYYNGYKFTISNSMNLLDAEKLIEISNNEVNCAYPDYYRHFNKYSTKTWISFNFITPHYYFVNNLRILSVLANCMRVKVYNFKNSQIVKSNIPKLDMIKLFPNLITVLDSNSDILYQK
jgi:hypothetical protein